MIYFYNNSQYNEDLNKRISHEANAARRANSRCMELQRAQVQCFTFHQYCATTYHSEINTVLRVSYLI